MLSKKLQLNNWRGVVASLHFPELAAEIQGKDIGLRMDKGKDRKNYRKTIENH